MGDRLTPARPRARVLVTSGNGDLPDDLGRLLGTTYDVETVRDSEAALRAAFTDLPDVLLLDLTLQGRSALALLEELQSDPRTHLVPVILVCTQANEDDAIRGLEAGADDYLVKPLVAKTLLARLRSSLSRAEHRKDVTDKLAATTKELETFSFSVSHDLRAPLRAVDGFSKALASDCAAQLDDEARGYLDRILAGTHRMAQLIDDLLGLSRITRMELAREDVDVSALANVVLGELAAREPARKVARNVAPDLTAYGDARLVRILLESLLGNAWKFSSKREGARIDVGAEVRDGVPAFFVRDNGAGFSMEYAHKLFAPFQRLHSVSEFPGNGIGLASAHRVVTRHGGHIWGESTPEAGATFFFTLGQR
jgi:signal transduction histidine kinase